MPMPMPEYDRLDALALADLVRRREVTASELLDEALRRVDERNPAVNAVVHRMDAEARAAIEAGLPEGPFTGVPFLVKDLLAAVAGQPLTYGSRFLRDYVPKRDSELVRRYRRAGLVICGKTATPELGLVGFTETDLFGITRNPWDLDRIPGGSSGGSASAVAARMVPAAHGGDGGGSIRIPASCCGLFGLKPTRGRTPMGPDAGEAWQGLVVEHALTRSVRDSAALLDATHGPDPGAACIPPPPARSYLREVEAEPGRLRIAFTSKPFLGSRVDPECVAGLESTAKLLESLGHRVEEAAPAVSGEEFALAFLTMLCGEVRADLEECAALMGRRPTARDFEAGTLALAMLGRVLAAGDFSESVRTMRRMARPIGAFFESWDALLTPTLALPPVAVGSLQLPPAQKRVIRMLYRTGADSLLKVMGLLKPVAQKSFDFTPYTPIFNVTGQPAMSLPLHTTASGLPIGMQLVGRWADEATLFRLAGQLERARPWADRMPALVRS